ncbi:hypothetical protein MLD38_030889 [Melastoma candidum]|uniref:Uncharacterized protein n=1 Tax=Melastoma candidum TaxID=119954 RepID=A0ACB9MMF8_9MYRT|nr:hypothetical protein MLD38_030889 [Melastoma candidum]
MSQDYHDPGVFTGFERLSTSSPAAPDAVQHHVPHQIRRDKLRVMASEFDPSMVGMEGETGGIPGYETSGMLSEMFNFGGSSVAGASASELLEQQHMAAGFRAHREQMGAAMAGDWYGSKDHQSGSTGVSIEAADSAAAMQLFLMNPQPRSPTQSPQQPHHLRAMNSSSSTLHMLLPNPSNSLQGFNSSAASFAGGAAMPPQPPPQFTWVPDASGAQGLNPSAGDIPRVAVEGQGLSLSLSSSLQHLEAAKAEEFRLDGNGSNSLLYFNNQVLGSGIVGGVPSAAPHHQFPYQSFPPPGTPLHLQSSITGYGPSTLGAVNILRNSKYLKATQELLEEFCSVGRGALRKSKLDRTNSHPSSSGNPAAAARNGGNDGGSTSTSKPKDTAAVPLSASDRMEHQRRKVKLLSMLDEVDRRYNHYCEQMQTVVNSFDLVMGFGSAVPYTSLAQKAMSRHFRCLKDAIAAQLKHSCEMLGEKDGAGNSGLTKGETPRLKLLDQSLRQQRAFHQMGMMEQEAWRPQRGLPERSVNTLRAWLFEHFLNPYPSDADKLLLARQTGLSRNQVSNWFINARVRLWKPMVEEMYQQEAKDKDDQDNMLEADEGTNPSMAGDAANNSRMPSAAAMASDGDISSINRQCFIENQPGTRILHPSTGMVSNAEEACRPGSFAVDGYGMFSNASTTHIQSFGNISGGNGNGSGNPDDIGSTLIRFGTASGDVSLTLGLRHAGNMPEKSSFSVTDYGSC